MIIRGRICEAKIELGEAYNAATYAFERAKEKLSMAASTRGEGINEFLRRVKDARLAAIQAREELVRHRQIHHC